MQVHDGRRYGDRISQKWPVEKSVFGHDKEGRPLKSEIAEKSWLGRFIRPKRTPSLLYFCVRLTLEEQNDGLRDQRGHVLRGKQVGVVGRQEEIFV